MSFNLIQLTADPNPLKNNGTTVTFTIEDPPPVSGFAITYSVSEFNQVKIKSADGSNVKSFTENWDRTPQVSRKMVFIEDSPGAQVSVFLKVTIENTFSHNTCIDKVQILF